MNGSEDPSPSPLHVESTGEGSPPLVLVHGFGAHGHFWRKWTPYLAARHRVHTVDLLGFGRAPTPVGADYSPGGQAGHLLNLLLSLGGAPPVLVGHSLGGGIALLTALLLRDALGRIPLRAIVAVSAAVYPQAFPRYLSLARLPLLGELFLLAPPPRWLLRRGIEGIVHDPATVDGPQVAGYRTPLRRLRNRRAILRAARQIDPEGSGKLVRRLGEIDVPTLLIWGEEDRIVPPELGRRLARELPRARLVTLPRVGHLPPEEAPEASVKPVLDFLTEREGDGTPSAPGGG